MRSASKKETDLSKVTPWVSNEIQNRTFVLNIFPQYNAYLWIGQEKTFINELLRLFVIWNTPKNFKRDTGKFSSPRNKSKLLKSIYNILENKILNNWNEERIVNGIGRWNEPPRCVCVCVCWQLGNKRWMSNGLTLRWLLRKIPPKGLLRH